jgi:hypothetical protein
MREILAEAYDRYSEDKILSIRQSLGDKIVLQMAQLIRIIPLPGLSANIFEKKVGNADSHRL